MRNKSLSANTLFHFTRNIDTLEGILKHEFQPHYSLENLGTVLSTLGDDFKVAIPMVCFCDIPLSQIHNHTTVYGGYALGLKKEWGKANGISPVLYAYKDASSSNYISSLAKQLILDSKDGIDIMRSINNFIKPYEGTLWKDGKGLENILFYDEREWRYVPSIDNEGHINQFLSEEVFLNSVRKAEETKKLNNLKLSFTPNDIKYIIVGKESEVFDMVTKIREIKGRFESRDVETLITRIISMERIREDF